MSSLPPASGVGVAGAICARGGRELLNAIVEADDTPGPVTHTIVAEERGGLAAFRRPSTAATCLAERCGVIAGVVGHPHDRFNGSAVTPEQVLTAYTEGSLAALARSCLGDFALAVVDPPRGEAVLVVDRTALRPVFYTTAGGDFRFASTVWGLASRRAPRFGVNYAGLASWLCFGYAMECQTLFQEVTKVEPGSILHYREGRIRVESYDPGWFERREDIQVDELIDRFDAACRHALRTLLPRDAPIAVFLSGGYDSRLIAAMMVRESIPFRAYNVPYDSVEASESRVAAEALGIPLEVVPIRWSLPDLYGNPLAWTPWGFPLRLHAPYAVVDQCALRGWAIDGLFGEWLRHGGWKNPFAQAAVLGSTAADVVMARQIGSIPEVLFLAPVAARIRQVALGEVDRSLNRFQVPDQAKHGLWMAFNRTANYTSTVHHFTREWVESVHPFASPDALDLLFSSPKSALTKETYRRLFATHYPRLGGLPHSRDMTPTHSHIRGWVWHYWRRVPRQLYELGVGLPGLPLRRPGLALRTAAYGVGWARWEDINEPLSLISMLAERLEGVGIALDLASEFR